MALPEDRRDDLELFLGAAAGDGAALPDPQTRVERYLAHIADPTVDKPDHPETRIELFLDAIEPGPGPGPGPGPSPILPEEYQEVEYIQSDGNSYLDTGIIPRAATGFKSKASLHEVTADKFHSGMRNDAGNTRFTFGSFNSLITAGYTTSIALGDVELRAVSVDTPFIISINYKNDKKIKYKGVELADVSSIVFPSNFTRSIYLLATNTGSPYPHSGDRIYSAEITSGSDLIFNGIPCYEKEDATSIGLYDTVSKTFFTNVGTGSLIKGPDVVSGDELLDAMEEIL